MAAVVPDIYHILENKWTELGATANITKRTLSLGGQSGTTGWYVKTFAESTVQGFIIPKGLRTLLPLPGIYIRYDAVCITETSFLAGDEITDAAGNIYSVEAALTHRFLDTLAFYSLQLVLKTVMPGVPSKWDDEEDFFNKLKNQLESHGLSADLTLFTLTLGATRDTTTGWYPPSYADSTIEGVIVPQAAAVIYDRPGIHTRKTSLLYTLAEVKEGDIVKDAGDLQYAVITRTPNFLANKLALYTCDLEQLQFVGSEVLDEFDGLGGWDIGSVNPCGGAMPYIDNTLPYSGANHAAFPQNAYIGVGVIMDPRFIVHWSIKGRMRTGTGTIYFEITYTDSTTTTFNEAMTTAYQEIDIKSHVTAGKIVSYVKIWSTSLAELLCDYYQLTYIG